MASASVQRLRKQDSGQGFTFVSPSLFLNEFVGGEASTLGLQQEAPIASPRLSSSLPEVEGRQLVTQPGLPQMSPPAAT